MARSTTTRSLALAAALSLGLGAFAGCGSSDSGSGSKTLPDSILIGATLPLTGPGAAYGEIMKDGLQMGLDSAKADGIVGDSSFKLDVRDSKAAAGPSVSATRELVAANAVAIVSAFTAPPLAQLPLVERGKVPLFNGGGNDPTLLGHDYLWNDVLTVDQEGYAGMTYLRDEQDAHTIGILFENDYTPAALDRLKAVAKDVTGVDAPNETVDQASSTVGTQLDKLLSQNPDALYLAVDGNIASLTIKELEQRNVDIPLMAYSGTAAVPEALQAPSLKFFYTAQLFNPTDEFNQAVEAAGVDPVTYLHQTYYNIGRVIASGLKEAEDKGYGTNGAGLQKALEGIASFEGCCGEVTFTDEHGVSSPVSVFAVEDGAPVSKAELASE